MRSIGYCAECDREVGPVYVRENEAGGKNPDRYHVDEDGRICGPIGESDMVDHRWQCGGCGRKAIVRGFPERDLGKAPEGWPMGAVTLESGM